MNWRRILAALLLSFTPLSARAAIRPSFSEGYSAWHATDVVVVDNGGRVLETWKGGLKPGDRLNLAELNVPRGEAISFELRKKTKNDPDRVSGNRTVLFLAKKKNEWAPTSTFGGMKVSVAWIERGLVYAFRQEINPGPTILVPLGITEKELRAIVEKADGVKQAMNGARSESDPVKRAEGALRFLDSDVYGAYWEVFEILATCGKDILPICRTLMASPKNRIDSPDCPPSLHVELLEAMVKAASQDARADLVRILEEEHAYWQKVGPKLNAWWGSEPMTRHYSRLHAALRKLGQLGLRPHEEKLVAAIRDHWKSLPQLDKIGNSQIADAAAAVLKSKE